MLNSNKILGIKFHWFAVIVIILLLNALGMYYYSTPYTLDEIAEKESAYLLSGSEKTTGMSAKKLFDTGVKIDTKSLTDYCFGEVKKRFGRKYKIAKMEPRDILDQANSITTVIRFCSESLDCDTIVEVRGNRVLGPDLR